VPQTKGSLLVTRTEGQNPEKVELYLMRQSAGWDALQRKSRADGKKRFDFSLFIGVLG
jgi:hypothetical protein